MATYYLMMASHYKNSKHYKQEESIMTGTTSYASKNAAAVLKAVEACMAELGAVQGKNTLPNPDRMVWKGYSNNKQFKIGALCNELSIFDWWNDYLSMSQLNQMKKFLEQAIKLGFTGYVCFKVGAKGCSHGMWAHTVETITGYSPEEGNTLYHSFRSGENYWDVKIDGEWLHEKMLHPNQNYRFTLAQVKEALTAAKREEVLQKQPEEEIDESKEIAESAMREFKVYFKDGNQKIFVAAGMMELMKYLARVNHDNCMGEISRIEEV